MPTDLELWYEHPASVWTEALPIGNGRLGAMVFGQVSRERLQLNESTFFNGGPYSPINPEARGHLDEVRSLIFARQYRKAEDLSRQHMMAEPYLQMSYQPIGDVWINFHHPMNTSEYRRSLDLDRAVAVTRYAAAGVTFTREAFASSTDGVIIYRIAADRPGAVSLEIALASPQPGEVTEVGADFLTFRGTNRRESGIAGALSFAYRARLIPTGGTMTAGSDALRVTNADSAIILIDAATSFRRFDDVSGDPLSLVAERLEQASRKSFDALLEEHVAEHRRLFRRLSVDLGRTAAADLPTDKRIAAYATSPDRALAALFLQYGRYLMISSSRPGTQPATLQGIWNDETRPPWGSKYTVNINTEMNYWLPDPANIAECFEPLIALLEDVAETGAAMAKAHYGAGGWVLHHNTDLWRATGPVDGPQWGLWPMGGAWLCAELWDHVQFGGDDALLRRVYPLMKGATEFLLDYLVVQPGADFLVTCPSLSPENPHPFGSTLCAGPAMDSQIMRDLFDGVVEASTRLGVDADFRAKVQAARARLIPDRIGKAGQLQEWAEDWDIDVPEPHHRHVSHLYGLYPSLQIDPDTTPALAAAARKSLEMRGDEATGWGIGWRLNLWARLRDGKRAAAVLTRLLSPDRSYPNLFDAHPPFQIDGNFGGAAGIIEMLVQSRPGEILLLPALSPDWPTGEIKGVRARGGIEVDLAWEAGKLTTATLRAAANGSVKVRYGNLATTASLIAGKPTIVRLVEGALVAEDHAAAP